MVLKLVKVPSNETLEICTQHTLQMGETEREREMVAGGYRFFVLNNGKCCNRHRHPVNSVGEL